MCGRGLDSGWDADQWLCVLRSGKMNCQKVLGGGGVLFFFFFFFFFFFGVILVGLPKRQWCSYRPKYDDERY